LNRINYYGSGIITLFPYQMMGISIDLT